MSSSFVYSLSLRRFLYLLPRSIVAIMWQALSDRLFLPQLDSIDGVKAMRASLGVPAFSTHMLKLFHDLDNLSINPSIQFRITYAQPFEKNLVYVEILLSKDSDIPPEVTAMEEEFITEGRYKIAMVTLGHKDYENLLLHQKNSKGLYSFRSVDLY